MKLNGTEVADKDDLITRIENGNGEAAILTIRRGEEYFDVKNRSGTGSDEEI